MMMRLQTGTSVNAVLLNLEISSNFNIQFLPSSVQIKIHLCLRINLRFVLDEDFGNGDLVLLGGQMHRRQSVLRLAIHVAAVAQQQVRNFNVAFLRSEVQWCISVLQDGKTDMSCSNLNRIE